jgi:RHS repeat-associated protein
MEHISDSETGLYSLGARYYDPTSGRFQSQDPIGFRAGDANLYCYVGNNPVNATDPSGLEDKIISEIKPGGPKGKLDPTVKPRDFSGNLTHRTFDFGTCGMTISAWYEGWRLDDDLTKPTIETMQFTAILGERATKEDKALLRQANWLQIHKLDRYKDLEGNKLDNEGKYTFDLFPKVETELKDALKPEVEYGKWYHDAPLLTSQWMTDHGRAKYQRTEQSLTFWDSPTAIPKLEGNHPLIVQSLEAYLVVDGKAVYVINWAVLNKWNGGKPKRTFRVSGGRIPTTLPDFLADPTAKLFRGKTGKLLKKDVDKFVNPIKGVVPLLK